jgi:hypothetical protein
MKKRTIVTQSKFSVYLQNADGDEITLELTLPDEIDHEAAEDDICAHLPQHSFPIVLNQDAWIRIVKHRK